MRCAWIRRAISTSSNGCPMAVRGSSRTCRRESERALPSVRVMMRQWEFAHAGRRALRARKANPKEENDRHPEFITPHAMCVDSKGDLYVLEWVPYGRPRKFTHTPA